MKTKLMLILLGCTLCFSTSAFSAQSCSEKENKLKTQIEYAKKYNNQYQLRGLQEALYNVQNYCTDSSTYSHSNSHSHSNQDCRKKEQQIKRKMEYAKRYNNQEQLSDLEYALKDVQSYCTDSSSHSHHSHSYSNQDCRKKEQQIKRKMEYAKRYNNQAQLSDLEYALKEVQSYCSN